MVASPALLALRSLHLGQAVALENGRLLPLPYA